jgi:uncharacterized membrane protein
MTKSNVYQRSTKAVVVLLGVGLLFRELTLPAAGLDPSWMLVTQYGLFERIDFSRYLIFSYGPLSFLTTRLFHPSVFQFAIIFQLLCVVIALWPALNLRWNGAFVVALLLCLGFNRINFTNDGVVLAAFFSSFTLAIIGRRSASLLTAAILAPLALSKASFFFAAIPLFVLADIYTVARKRSVPLQTLVVVTTVALTFVAVGQSLAGLPRYFRNSYEISRFYSQAMSSPLGAWGLVTLLPFLAFGIGLFVLLLRSIDRLKQKGAPWAGHREELAMIMMGLLWLFLVMYKASFVRADNTHYFIGWNGLLLIAPVLLFLGAHMVGDLRTFSRVDLLYLAAACAVFFVTVDLRSRWREERPEGIAQMLENRAKERISDIKALAGWLNPSKRDLFERNRIEALNQIAMKELPPAGATVDVYPADLAPAIAAGLSYRPRPTMQSYVAYSPYLQNLDLDHWRSDKAPTDLLFKLTDIDDRLPTMALGPSIVEILSRYDAVGRIAAQVHLQRRKVPRRVVQQAVSSNRIALGEWIPIPNATGQLILAQTNFEPTVFGSLITFLESQPILTIQIRLATGEVRSFRFIPSMAELGFAISPDLDMLLGDRGGTETDVNTGLEESVPVEALRISGGVLAQDSFERGTITFSTVQYQ